MDKEIGKGQQQNDNCNTVQLEPNQGNSAATQSSNDPQSFDANTVVSQRSDRSQSRRLQLQLQRLEEEREINLEQVRLQREYLNKKYQLLEEADNFGDLSSIRAQSVQSWVDEIPSKDNTLAATNMAANGSTLNKAAYLSDIPLAMSNRRGEQNSSNVNPTGINTSNMPQTLNVCSYPPVTQSTSTANEMVAPICAKTTATSSGNQRRTQFFDTQNTSHQPTNVTFSHLPATDCFYNSVSNNYFNAGSTFPCVSTIPPTSNNNPNISFFNNTNTPFYTTQNYAQSTLNARQSVPKELPIFSGNPEDWPLFISTFEWSSTTCCFSDTENLIRLQKSLRGDALQSVKHMLVHPSNVVNVIEILRILYGQPEKILNSIKNRISSSPKVDGNNVQSLTSFAINVRSLLSTINASNLPDEINNSSLLQQLLEKLPITYQMQWASLKLQLINEHKKPNLFEFDRWLFNIGLTASTILTGSTLNKQTKDITTRNHASSYKQTTTTKSYLNSHSDERKCVVCNNSNCRTVSDCKTYRSLDRNEKWKIIRENKLCKHCLTLHSGECRRKKKCGEENCDYYHHPSLHRFSFARISDKNKDTSGTQNVQNANEQEEEVIHNSHSEEDNNILFKILPVKIHGNGKIIATFAFIDEGSSISLMDESVANDLELNGVSSQLCLRWTGGIQRNEQNSKKLVIEVSGENGRHVKLNVNTVDSLNLPMQSLDYKKICQQHRHLRNLPIKSYVDAVPKLLIGLNHFNLGISNKTREGGQSEPVAVQTKLGWLIYGTTATNKHTRKHFNYHICNCSEYNTKLEDLVKNFYTLESIGISAKYPLVSENEIRALNLLKSFTIMKENSHYEVPLLWRYDNFKLPDSFDMALKRLTCLERKLIRNSNLFQIFKDTITSYLNKNYIRKLNENEIERKDGKIWYLPIFAVFNKNKPGKSRVVWDAAAKSEGVSLNSFLLKGPDMLASLPAILFKFRQNFVAVCGDIEEMFLQIHIRPEDRDVQRFLWRDCDQSKAPDVYVMDVMIFGATCAPSISQYIKNVNADKFQSNFPTAVKSIKENHYVDDLLDSVSTPEDAVRLITDVSYIHRQAGFNIRNWVSNSELVRQKFSTATANGVKCINFKDDHQVEKVLGVFWKYKEDTLTFKIASWLLESDLFFLKKPPTKREMLRLIMSIYDPLGLISHITIFVKILMQDVWRSKVDWDEYIPLELFNKWSRWVKCLPDLKNIKVPRCYLKSFRNYENIDIQLHTFVDASVDAYAAVSYFRLSKDGIIICSLVSAKTRVAPMKITSVPRLELMAALIGARLAKFIAENHGLEISQKYFWCDSKTVLSWINSDHRKYNQFVAFRVTEILELTSMAEWNWVSSKDNVADEATKCSKIQNSYSSSRWFNGPEFLYKPIQEWPKTEQYSNCVEEERKQHIHQIATYGTVIDMFRFSKYSRLLRTVAYVLRFANKKGTRQIGELTQEELNEAELVLYKQVQREEYFLEISALKSNKPIKRSSDIYSKSPYLDNGILRVNGRIDMANISMQQKRPIILPRKNYLTGLICLHYHEKFYHGNHETVVNELRQKYCISRLRATYKSIVRCCQMCKITKAMPQIPQMAKLPRARLATYTAPFTYTGVDFFGPVLVTVNRHKEKRYGCLFTCLTIRAVHIEIAHSLTTSSCILAIRNFMGRRGVPLEFFSDNGTNFVGAERELREAMTAVDRDELIKLFTTSTTKWNFNPPASPHMGGAWERLVRSVKTILYKIMPSRQPTDEHLLSMVVEVENIINSRPLAYVPIEAETEEAITPNHFLIGSSSGLKPLTSCNDSGTLLRQSWLTSQQYANLFWKKWLAEYLPTLTCRTKWHEKARPLSQGDLVIIVDPSLPRNVWPRGKVLALRLANDQQTRSAKILTRGGIMERPVSKLAVLEVAPPEKFDSEEVSCHTAGGMLTQLPNSP